MKSNRLMSIMIVAIALSLSSTVFAQQGMGRPERPEGNPSDQPMRPECKREHCGGNDFDYLKLSEDQKGKIKGLKMAHSKESIKLRNRKEELKAHLQTLSTADVADMKAINTTIDEITQNQNQLMKSRENFKQQVRALLTEEQRIEFDQKEAEHPHHAGKGMHHPDEKE